MRRPKQIFLTISFIKELDNPGYYIELYGGDEAGIEIKDNGKPEEKINTIGHELAHFILEYFLPSLPTKRRKTCLTEKEEQGLCTKAGEFLELLLKPYLKYYREDSLGTQK